MKCESLTDANKELKTNLEPPRLEHHDTANQVVPHLLSNVQAEAAVLIIQLSLLLITVVIQ